MTDTTPKKIRRVYSEPPLEWRASTLPLDLFTRIDAERVVVSMRVPGMPHRKQRPQINMKTRTIYTPGETVRAERAWRKVMLEARRGEIVNERVGVLLYFRVPPSRGKSDVDNLTKLVLDAGNGVIWRDDSLVSELHAFVGRNVPLSEAGSDLIVWVR